MSCFAEVSSFIDAALEREEEIIKRVWECLMFLVEVKTRACKQEGKRTVELT